MPCQHCNTVKVLNKSEGEGWMEKKVTANKSSERKKPYKLCTLNKSAVDKNIAAREIKEKNEPLFFLLISLYKF